MEVPGLDVLSGSFLDCRKPQRWLGKNLLSIIQSLSFLVDYYLKAIEAVPAPEFLIGISSVYPKMGKPEEAKAQLQLVSNIRKVYEANGASMDPEILQMMEKAGIERVGS